jgi:anti-anti-sigma factor
MSPSSQPCGVQPYDLRDRTVLRFTGRRVVLDEHGTRSAGDHLLALVGGLKAGRLLLDFGNVAYLNAATLGLLVLLHTRLQARGRRLIVCNLAPHLYEVFEVTNLHRLFDVRPPADGPQAGGRHERGSTAVRPTAPASSTASAGAGPRRSPLDGAAATRSISSGGTSLRGFAWSRGR